MSEEELEWAETIYHEMGVTLASESYGWWKRTTEDFIGRTMEPTEAQEMYQLVSRRTTWP